jgi:CRISPR-associated protein Cmr6
MRDVFRGAIKDTPASNFGQAYDLLAPPPREDGKVDPQRRDEWLRRCEQIAIAGDYALFYERWKRSFASDEVKTREVIAASRVLVGHGNPSGSDVGLRVLRTWGVPVLPGSALKGLAAHYVDAVHGAADNPERRTWLGPTWKGRRIEPGDGAGAAFAGLFGAPEVDGEEGSARRGRVEFHDALYVPGSANGKPFARDVLTVHQKTYYDSNLRPSPKKPEWPSDWDSPNPVGFVTVKPGARFLLALTGPNDWAERAMALLLAGLAEWGIGGKTSAGYGRLLPSGRT